MITESKILWLGIGVFVGFLLWGENHRRGNQSLRAGGDSVGTAADDTSGGGVSSTAGTVNAVPMTSGCGCGK